MTIWAICGWAAICFFEPPPSSTWFWSGVVFFGVIFILIATQFTIFIVDLSVHKNGITFFRPIHGAIVVTWEEKMRIERNLLFFRILGERASIIWPMPWIILNKTELHQAFNEWKIPDDVRHKLLGKGSL